MIEIKILWGSAPEPDAEPITYRFNTLAEANAFLKGVDEACGWMDYALVEDE